MAEFCLDCVNKIYSKKKPLREKDVIMDMDYCEECGEWKPCVISLKRPWWKRLLSHIKTRY